MQNQNENTMRDIRVKPLILLVFTMILLVGCKKEKNDTVSDTDYEYIDLGLPSGTLWAVCNVGASSPEEIGNYFSWGETETKDFYDWKHYKYCEYADDDYLLTKYCTNSNYGFNGFVDNLTVLELTDDAVCANWGANWRMPTREEFDELYQNTTFTWTTINGVEGRLMTGSNGNSIFLPATGFIMDDELICTGLGIYWSSTLQSNSQVAAFSLHFDNVNCHVCGTYERSRGHVVRAVYCANQASIRSATF